MAIFIGLSEMSEMSEILAGGWGGWGEWERRRQKLPIADGGAGVSRDTSLLRNSAPFNRGKGF
jgi:hypothetical protein